MASHAAIADAGKTLVELLRDRLTLDSRDQIALASPADEDLGSTVRLTVYLFDVDESGHVANVEYPQGTDPPPREGPLRLDLKYLLTAHNGGGTTTTAETANEHKMLGRAMQVLEDNAVVQGPDLQGTLRTNEEALHVSILPKTTDAVANVWNTFDREPYQPSVAYLVTPVEIESRHDRSVERVEHAEFEEHVRVGEDDG